VRANSSAGTPLQTLPYREDRLVLVVPRQHPLAGRASARFADVLDWDIVGLHAGSSISLAMRRPPPPPAARSSCASRSPAWTPCAA
jgi:DNA-binding transcriptional LysR family regulator